MMMSNLRPRWPVFCLTVLLGIFAGCSRRVSPPPPVPAVNNIPNNIPNPPPVRDVAILYHTASGYADVAAELKRLLPADTYRVVVVDVQAESSKPGLDLLRRKLNLFTVAIGL